MIKQNKLKEKVIKSLEVEFVSKVKKFSDGAHIIVPKYLVNHVVTVNIKTKLNNKRSSNGKNN